MVERKDGVAGYAIGGLSGGEEKGIALGLSSIGTIILISDS
jgi:hypothetical protein